MSGPGAEAERILRSVDSLMDEMISQQQKKVLELARRLNPELNGEDLMSPYDFPALAGDPRFNFEDGLLAGLTSARTALRARVIVPSSAESDGEGSLR